MSRYDLQGKVGIVTGAGQGMGRATALRLAQEGVAVTVADINLETARSVAGEIQAAGGKALALKVDVGRKQDAERVVADTVAQLGPLDILVNNAGVLRVKSILDMAEEDWDFHMDINGKGVFLCSQAAARQMVSQGKGGRIITIGTTAARLPAGKDSYLAAYCASKAAGVLFSRQLGQEMAKHNILVNVIFPGVVDTDMLVTVHKGLAKYQGVPAERIRKSAEEAIPIGYFQQPEKVANMVAFLCSSDADYSVSSIFDVTGGAYPY